MKKVGRAIGFDARAMGRAELERRIQLATAEAQAYADERLAADGRKAARALEERALLATAEALAYADERAATPAGGALGREGRGADGAAAAGVARVEMERRVQLAVSEAQSFAQDLAAPLARDVGAFRQHVPGFLNAVSSVAAFGHGLAELRRKVESAAVREEGARAGVDTLGERLTRALEEAERRAEAQQQGLAELRREVALLAGVRADHEGALDQLRRGFEDAAGRSGEDSANLWRAVSQANRNVGELWSRLEFVRKEIMYEMRFAPGGTSAARERTPPRVVAADKVEAARKNGLKLNLGCGHVPLDGYVNVDQRELPGVDVVADAGDLPFEPGSVQEVFSAHVLEHFPQEQLRRLLPYWRSLIRPAGTFRAVVPDGEAMLAGIAARTVPFEHFRMVLFGAQEYEGDFHYNLLTPDSLSGLLTEAGFSEPRITARGRQNDICLEFEIEAAHG